MFGRRKKLDVWYLNGEKMYSDYESPEWQRLEQAMKNGVYPRDPEQRQLYDEYKHAMNERSHRGGLLDWLFGR